MNYQKTYRNLINSRKALNRIKSNTTYYESHHILPKCIGGLDTNDNLILLTPREHFIAHKLLAKAYPQFPGLRLAVLHMCNSSKTNKERIITISAREYEQIKNNTKGISSAIVAKTGEKIIVQQDDPRWKTGEIHAPHKGTCNAIVKHTGQIIHVSVNDPRWKTKEIIGTSKGKVPCFNNKTKELVFISTEEFIKGKAKGLYESMMGEKVVPCICNKTKETIMVSKEEFEEGIASQELSHINSGKVPCRDLRTGKCIQVSKAEFQIGKADGIYDHTNKFDSKECVIEGVKYASVQEASEKLNLTIHQVRNRIRSNLDKYVNWHYLNNTPSKKQHYKAKPCIIDGNKYNSAVEASKYIPLNPNTISKRIKSTKHPTWKYIEA